VAKNYETLSSLEVWSYDDGLVQAELPLPSSQHCVAVLEAEIVHRQHYNCIREQAYSNSQYICIIQKTMSSIKVKEREGHLWSYDDDDDDDD